MFEAGSGKGSNLFYFCFVCNLSSLLLDFFLEFLDAVILKILFMLKKQMAFTSMIEPKCRQMSSNEKEIEF